MKKLLFLFAVLLTSVGAWAITYPTEGVMYTIKNVHGFVNNDNGYKHYMAANAGRTEVVGVAESAISYRAKWFFEEVSGDGLDNSFYLKNAFTGMYVYIANPKENSKNVTLSFENKTPFYLFDGSKGNGSILIGTQNSTSSTWGIHGNVAMDTWEGSGDGNQWLIEESTVTNAADADYVTSQKSIIKTAPGYPKTTTQAYLDLYHMPQGLLTQAEIDALVTSYKTCADIILPEDGKAYTFTNVRGNNERTERYMKYVNGQKVSVSTDKSDASVFVCKELRAGVYAFVTTDGHILTWIGNDETGAYKENNNIYGYSSNYATVYNAQSDWNEIHMEKYGATVANFGHLHLWGRRHKDGLSALIVKHTENRFDQSGNSKYFNDTFSSAWILTEVAHTNNDAENDAIAEINATIAGIAHVDANTSKLGTAIGYAHYMIGETKTTDVATLKTTINNATSAEAVNAIVNSFAYETPEAETKYVLYDVAHKVFLDINNFATAPEQPQCTELAKLNSEKQSLYITATANQWKIHTTAEGGNYLGQYTDANQWNSRVHADLNGFEWEECPTVVDGEILYSLKNNSGQNNGFLGAGGHTNGKALFVNQAEGDNQLKLKLHKSDFVYKFVVVGHPVTASVIYKEKQYNNGDFICADDIITETDITISEHLGYNKTFIIDEETKTITVTYTVSINFNDGDKILIRNRDHANDYIGAEFIGGKLDNTAAPTTKRICHLAKDASNFDYKFCWELKATTHGEEQCFYLYNPYYDWYVSSITSTNGHTNMSKTEAGAGKYKIELQNSYFVFHCLTSTVTDGNKDCNFLHFYTWGGSTEIVGWERASTASQWIIEDVTEDMELQWQNTLTSQYNTLTQHEIGTGVNQYSGMPDALVDGFNALALPEEASAIEKARYCVYALYEYGSAVDALTLNIPSAGFYRFKAYNTNKYLQNYSKNNNFQLIADNGVNSIMYLGADKTILSYGTGQYANDHANPVAIGTEALPWSIVENNSVVGRYALDMANHGYLDIHNSWVASSNNNNASSAWEIERVETLPFTFKKAALGFATFNAPVTVQLPADVLAYITDMDETNKVLQMYRLEGNVVPANTAVMLYNKKAKADDAPVETTIDLVIVGAYTGDEFDNFDGENDFVGTVAAKKYPTTGETVYSLRKKQKEQDSDPDMVGFYKKESGTDLGGFKAWIMITEKQGAQGRAFTIIFDGDDATGLKEALGLENENVEIYDLSGRRLDKPAKGVNVIGGKLVIK